MDAWRIHLSPPDVGADERALLVEAFDSNWIAPLGPQVDAFERELAARVGARHAVALSSGTAGLHLGLLACGVEPGGEVLVPTLTFAASANAVTYVGARPVFVDADPTTWQIDPQLLEREVRGLAAAGRLPQAIMPVDLFGQTCDHDAIAAVADRYGIPVVEDAAEALGATYRGQAAGTFGRCGVFSFNGNKIITTSGGGMLVTDDADLADRARSLATQARDPAPHYEHSSIGFNYRLSNLLAAVGRGQLRHLDEKVARRRAVNGRYRGHLAALPGLAFMPIAAYGEPTSWLTCIVIDPERFGADREAVRTRLAVEGIEARPLWKPMHLQPVFAACRTRGGAVAADLFERGLCLPSGSGLRDDEVDEVAELIASVSGSGPSRGAPRRSAMAAASPVG